MTQNEAAPSPLAQKIDTEIERWFAETIHNSPVSRATDIYNHLREAVAQLKPRLIARIEEI